MGFVVSVGCALGWFGHVPWCGFFLLVSLVAFALLWAGYGFVPLCPGCGCSFVRLVCLLACKVGLVGINSPLPGVWAWLYLVVLPIGFCFCCCGLLPLSYF